MKSPPPAQRKPSSTLKQLVDRVASELQATAVRKLQDYLLGRLSPKQRTAIERRMIESDDFFEQLLLAEDNLIQDYVRGLLPSELHEGVARLVRTSRTWADKVQFAEATQVLIARKSNQLSSPRTIELLATFYDELTALAKRHLSGYEREFEPAELVNEAVLALREHASVGPYNKVELVAMAARQMRRVLVDFARAHHAMKRGGQPPEALTTDLAKPPPEERILDLDFALDALGTANARASRIVELKFFGGLTDHEIAQVLGVSPRTVKREWHLARAWLHAFLSGTNTVQ